MSVYTVRWVPIGPEISVSCPSLEEAMVLADELVAIGRIGHIQILKDNQILAAEFEQNDPNAMH